jgi:hypothetical protein
MRQKPKEEDQAWWFMTVISATLEQKHEPLSEKKKTKTKRTRSVGSTGRAFA